MAKREWFPRQRDALQRHRNLITYLLVVLGLLGALVGWGLLPDMVTIRPPTAANHHYVPKGQGGGRENVPKLGGGGGDLPGAPLPPAGHPAPGV